MPDTERLLRELELWAADTPEDRAYVRGTHDGIDRARKQFVFILVGLVVIVAGLMAMGVLQ